MSSIEQIIDQLLEKRGIKSTLARRIFFDPQLKDFEKDLEIPGIDKAVKRIQKAIKNEEQIIVYGDYDVDGVCATAIMYHALTRLGAKVLPYIPHREKEGYGLSPLGLDAAKAKGATLVITVDSGIVAFEQAKYAKSIGIDLVITDHHVALEKTPSAVALVHSTVMCGSGVAWCLARHLTEADDLLDLVAIATIGDMMPLVGVNRWFVKEGLKLLHHSQRPGLKALFLECAIVPTDITAYHLSHVLGPRINAMGRMGDAMDSLRLLCTGNETKAQTLARKLTETNELKKQLTVNAIEEARKIADQLSKEANPQKILIVHSKEWIPGIIGLVAARLAEEYKLPTIAISEGEGQSKASARSSGGVNIVEAIRKCSDLLIDVGGHPAAAGFTIHTERISSFKEKMFTVMEAFTMTEQAETLVDAEIGYKDITRELLDRLEELQPFGLGNPKPIFASKRMRIDDMKAVGEGKHLKLNVNGIDAIAFSKGHMKGLLKLGQSVDVIYNVELNKFNGRENIQMNIVEIKV